MKWFEKKERFATGSRLVHLNILMGATSYDSCQPKGSNENWYSYCALPDAHMKKSHHADEKSARIAVEAAIKEWFEKFGLLILAEPLTK